MDNKTKDIFIGIIIGFIISCCCFYVLLKDELSTSEVKNIKCIDIIGD